MKSVSRTHYSQWDEHRGHKVRASRVGGAPKKGALTFDLPGHLRPWDLKRNTILIGVVAAGTNHRPSLGQSLPGVSLELHYSLVKITAKPLFKC